MNCEILTKWNNAQQKRRDELVIYSKKKKKGWISKALLWVKEVSKGYVLYDSFIGHSEKVKNTGIKNR